MSSEDERLEKIKQVILQHKGKANAIKSKTIARMIDIEEDDTHVTTRGLITKLFKAGLPIGASNNGYFLIETQEEVDEYSQTLNNRVEEVYDRLGRLQFNFDRFYGRKTGRKRNKLSVIEDPDIF